jgi:two-component system, OmpR family, alkaline phosphatase synthesis response regulator PhoP
VCSTPAAPRRKHASVVSTFYLRGDPRLSSMPSAVVAEPVMHILPRVLVIAEDRAAQRALQRLLQSDGYDVAVTANEAAGLELLRAAPPVAVVLDLHRGANSAGRDIFRKIRQFVPEIPIVVLGTLSESGTILLLELGADDYVSRPFSGRELLARVRGAVRRSLRTSARETFAFGDVNVDFRNMELRREGAVVPLTPQEFKILKFMVQNAARVISRDELLNEVWGCQKSDSRRTVDNHILRLRQKLEVDPAHPVHFRTVHGFGYKFVP